MRRTVHLVYPLRPPSTGTGISLLGPVVGHDGAHPIDETAQRVEVHSGGSLVKASPAVRVHPERPPDLPPDVPLQSSLLTDRRVGYAMRCARDCLISMTVRSFVERTRSPVIKEKKKREVTDAVPCANFLRLTTTLHLHAPAPT